MTNKKYSLPDMTFSFEIAVKGAETQNIWSGKFRYKRPTLGDRTRIDSMKARLIGTTADAMDHEVREFIEAISHLRFTLEEYPDWWAEAHYGMELYDGNVVSEIYNRVLEYEVKFQEKIFSGDKKDVEPATSDVGDVPESTSAAIEASASAESVSAQP